MVWHWTNWCFPCFYLLFFMFDLVVRGHGCKSVTPHTHWVIISHWIGLSLTERTLRWRILLPSMRVRLQTHHLSLGARGQRYMWATVTCLKVTAPDRSNLYHPRQRAWWMRLSSFYQCPCPRSRIDGRGAAWRAVPTSCLPGSQTCNREIIRSSKQTRLTEKLSICWNFNFNIFYILS